MSTERRYRLADSTVVEPLVQQWSAWPQLLSPVPAGLHLLNYQKPALEDYLKNPDAHVKASRDPEMIGGPFVDIPPERAPEIERLLRRTLAERGAQMELARTVHSFHNRLVEEARGQCLEPFYERVPAELAGYVELVYDYYNRPTVRFFESLLYESQHYRSDLQSLRLWTLKRDETRPFFMSTPRLLEEGQLDWQVPYADPRVEELFRLDVEPRPLSYISELLGLGGGDERLLLPLLSEEPPTPRETWRGPEARVRYFGHACVVVEWNGVSVMTDPYVGARPTEGGLERYSYGDLPAKIDYALVTHIHQDHFALETLLRLRHRIEHLVVPKSSGLLYGDMSLKLMARKLGFRSVVELDPLEAIGHDGVEIVGVPFLGEHGDLAHSKSGYVVRLGGTQMLFGADSDCLDRQLYVNVRRALGEIETVFLGTESVGAPLFWGCGPLFPIKQERHIEQTRRYHGSNARSALEILETVGARRIYNYAMGMEAWVEHLLGLGLTEHDPQYVESEKLLRRAHGRGLVAAERFYGRRELHVPVPRAAGESGGREGQSDAEQVRYFGRLLDEAAPVFERRHDAGDGDGFDGEAARARQTFTLDAGLCGRLKSLGGGRPGALREALLGAWLATLRHYTGGDEFFVGVNVVGGTGTQVLYADLSGNPTVNALLARSKGVYERAGERARFAHELPATAQLRFELKEEGEASAAESEGVEGGYGVGLFLRASGRGAEGTAEYDPGLLEAAEASEMVEYFRRVAEVFAADPERRLDEVLRRAEESLAPLAASHATRTPDAEDQFAF